MPPARPNMPAVFREFVSLDRRRKADGLSIAELARWTALKQMLNQKFQPDLRNSEDRRNSIRVPVNLKVSFESYGELRDSLMTNLSRGGLFIETDTLLPIGTPFELHIRVEESGDEIEICGEVVSHNSGTALDSNASGMGIRFVELDEAGQKIVDDLYEGALGRALGAGDNH